MDSAAEGKLLQTEESKLSVGPDLHGTSLLAARSEALKIGLR